MVILGKNLSPPILKKKSPSSTIKKISPPWVDKYLCLINRFISIFRSMSLVDKKNPLRGILKFHIEADLKRMIYADIPGILL